MNDYTRSELEIIQRQAKALNKRIARTQRDTALNNDVIQDVIEGMIDDYITASGRVKAGAKMIEAMSNAEIEQYIANLEQANTFISNVRMSPYISEAFSRVGTTDATGESFKGIWAVYDYMDKHGVGFESQQIKEIEDAELTDYEQAQVMAAMLRAGFDDDYGLSDFSEEVGEILGHNG